MCKRGRRQQKPLVHRCCSRISSSQQVDPPYSSDLSGHNLSSQKWMVKNYPCGHQAQRWDGEAGSHDATILPSWCSFQIVRSSVWMDYRKRQWLEQLRFLLPSMLNYHNFIYMTLCFWALISSPICFSLSFSIFGRNVIFLLLTVVDLLKRNNSSIKCPRIGVLDCVWRPGIA